MEENFGADTLCHSQMAWGFRVVNAAVGVQLFIFSGEWECQHSSRVFYKIAALADSRFCLFSSKISSPGIPFVSYQPFETFLEFKYDSNALYMEDS